MTARGTANYVKRSRKHLDKRRKKRSTTKLLRKGRKKVGPIFEKRMSCPSKVRKEGEKRRSLNTISMR